MKRIKFISRSTAVLLATNLFHDILKIIVPGVFKQGPYRMLVPGMRICVYFRIKYSFK